MRPVLWPYTLVKVCGVPPAGVNVPVNLRTTQCVLLTHADWPLDACTVTTPVLHVAVSVCDPLPPAARAEETASAASVSTRTVAAIRRFTLSPSSIALVWDTRLDRSAKQPRDMFCLPFTLHPSRIAHILDWARRRAVPATIPRPVGSASACPGLTTSPREEIWQRPESE